jgi:hypothetical protein
MAFGQKTGITLFDSWGVAPGYGEARPLALQRPIYPSFDDASYNAILTIRQLCVKMGGYLGNDTLMGRNRHLQPQ